MSHGYDNARVNVNAALHRLLKIPQRPPVPANLSASERVSHLESVDCWVDRCSQRLDFLGTRLRQATPLLLGAAAGSGLLAAAGVVIPGVALAVILAAGALLSHGLSKQAARAKEQLDAQAPRVGMALQRARVGLKQIRDAERAKHEELARSVTSLAQAPSASLLEQKGILLLPGVRLGLCHVACRR